MLDADNKPLFLEKKKIDREEMEFTVVVDRKPARAGIDPYNKLIDRRPKDNTIAGGTIGSKASVVTGRRRRRADLQQLAPASWRRALGSAAISRKISVFGAPGRTRGLASARLKSMLTFQQVILTLQDYWGDQGCALLQPYDMEVGAGTSHTATFLRALGPEPWRAAYVQPSRRPKDGRYGENPNRLHQHHQFQVVLKPSPPDILDLYLGSLEALGFDLKKNDVRFVEDDWENPTLGAWGLGWEVWLNGMEITQFTYFQQVGGLDCNPITGEITYGLERMSMYLQNVESVYDLALHRHDVLPRRVLPERGRAVEVRVRRIQRAEAVRAVRVLRGRGEAAAGGEAAAARLRDDPQGRRTRSTCSTRAARSR